MKWTEYIIRLIVVVVYRLKDAGIRLTQFAGLFANRLANQVHGQGKDDGGVLFGGDLSQGLQVAQLKCRLGAANDVGSFLERAGSITFSFGSDYLSK